MRLRLRINTLLKSVNALEVFDSQTLELSSLFIIPHLPAQLLHPPVEFVYDDAFPPHPQH